MKGWAGPEELPVYTRAFLGSTEEAETVLSLFLRTVVLILEEPQDHRVVERVVEEDVLSQSPFLPESHLLCEGYARLVLSIGPPAGPMKVQLFEGLFQEEADYFSPVSLSPEVFLSYS